MSILQSTNKRMRTIIAGSRTLTDPKIVEEAIAASGFTITEVVCGGARGIDTLGKNWADARGIPVKVFPADWETHGKAAGPIRNSEMAAYAEQAICVVDAQAANKGTWDMSRKATAKGLIVYVHPANLPEPLL